MSKQYRINLNVQLCVACGACSVACMDQNDLEPRDVRDMFRKVTVQEKGSGDQVRFTYQAQACRHCGNAPCVKACPMGCMAKDPETGFTIYDNTDCVGCGACAQVCPFDAIVFNGEGKAMKCDGCYLRVQYGLEPACVRACPFDALTLTVKECK